METQTTRKMITTEWQEKFSSIVKQTETNLDRVKQTLSSTKMRNSPPPTDILSNFAVSTRTSAYSLSGDIDLPLTRHKFSSMDTGGSNMATSVLPIYQDSSVTDDIKYIPLHESPSVIMYLQDKLEEQSKIVEDLVKRLQKNEEEKISLQKEVFDLKDTVEGIRRETANRERNSPVEQKVDALQQEMKTELRLMNNKFNYLKNRDDETAVTVDLKNSSVSNIVIDLQKYVRGEIEGFRREMDVLKTRLTTVQNGLTQVMLTGPEPLLDQREPREYRNHNTVSFLHNSETLNPRDSSGEHVQLYELKNSLKDMQKKLRSLESNLLPESEVTLSSPRKKKHRQKPNLTKNLLSPETSELDITTATDLITFTLKTDGKSDGSQLYDINFTDASDLSSEDDITLDDL